MGHLNAKVGRNNIANIVGSFGIGERNERREKCVNWSQKNGQVICNTWFGHHIRKLWTWKSPTGKTKY